MLHAEEVDLSDLAAAVGTPFYCYSTATLERHYRVFAEAFAGIPDTLVCYSVKANSNLGVLATLAAPAPAWTWSPKASFAARSPSMSPRQKIVFSGVGKTRAEMAFALDARHLRFQRRVRARA